MGRDICAQRDKHLQPARPPCVQAGPAGVVVRHREQWGGAPRLCVTETDDGVSAYSMQVSRGCKNGHCARSGGDTQKSVRASHTRRCLKLNQAPPSASPAAPPAVPVVGSQVGSYRRTSMPSGSSSHSRHQKGARTRACPSSTRRRPPPRRPRPRPRRRPPPHRSPRCPLREGRSGAPPSRHRPSRSRATRRARPSRARSGPTTPPGRAP